MILVYVSDGPRDHESLPPLVRTATGLEHQVRFKAWHDLTLHGKGFAKKLTFMITEALVDGHQGVVAVVDQDRSKGRLKALSEQRERDRHLGMRVAVGEAIPHVDAWLIDDLVALRQVLGLDPEAKAPSGKYPKHELDALIKQSGFTEGALTAVASAVSPDRCRNAKSNGLAAFLDDCRAELPPPR